MELAMNGFKILALIALLSFSTSCGWRRTALHGSYGQRYASFLKEGHSEQREQRPVPFFGEEAAAAVKGHYGRMGIAGSKGAATMTPGGGPVASDDVSRLFMMNMVKGTAAAGMGANGGAGL